MDENYFLKQRTDFIRLYYDSAAKPFAEMKDAIENERAPFDNPPHSEDPEPILPVESMPSVLALKAHRQPS